MFAFHLGRKGQAINSYNKSYYPTRQQEESRMRSKSFDGMACPIASVMAAIGDRWGMLVLRDLVLGLSRYEDIRASTGATHATLSDRLKHLEAHGLVARQRYRVNPERFEYLLTVKGRRLGLAMSAFAHIGAQWTSAEAAKPSLTFVNARTGARAALAFIDQDTGEPLGGGDVAILAGPGADSLMQWRLAQGEQRRREQKAGATQAMPASGPA